MNSPLSRSLRELVEMLVLKEYALFLSLFKCLEVFDKAFDFLISQLQFLAVLDCSVNNALDAFK